MTNSLYRRTAVLYFLAAICLLFVFYLKPVSWYPDDALQDYQDFTHDYQRRFHKSPPKGIKNWHHHARRHQCETRDFYDAMDQDLKYFRSQQLQWDQVIPQATQYTGHYMAFSLENHELTVVDYKGHESFYKPVLRLIRLLLEPAIQHVPALTSKFVFNLHDTAQKEGVNATYPIFSVCKMDYYTDNQPPTSSNHTTFDLSYHPGPDFVASPDLLVPWWFSLRRQSIHLWWWPFYGSGLPFSYRRDAITWRGSTTSGWETGPRFRLVKGYGSPHIHKLHDNHTTTNVDADFAFIKVVQKPGHVEALSPGYRFAKHQFYWQMQLRKYILDVDGNGFTSRFPGLLRSGSVVFKSTRYREWFHGILMPYEDYIPVRYDLSDLVGKVAWAQANPSKAKEMARHSRQSIEQNFRVVDMQCFMYRLLLEYQELFDKQQ